jgi:hypothetical protein
MSYSRFGKRSHFYAFIGRKDGKMECAFQYNMKLGENCMLLTPKRAKELIKICQKYITDVERYKWKISERL